MQQYHGDKQNTRIDLHMKQDTATMDIMVQYSFTHSVARALALETVYDSRLPLRPWTHASINNEYW